MDARIALAVSAFAVTAAAGVNQKPVAPTGVAPASVVQVPSPSVGGTRAVTVLLPASYSKGTRRYPVLYLLHGGGQDHTAFATRAWFRAQTVRDIIIVTPNAGESWYINSVIDPAARYEDFVIKDVTSYIDTHYRTTATRQSRAIAGVSMGGWGAMFLGLKHHQLFGAVGALSGPFLISRQSPNMDMKAREQQGFGVPGSPERLERDPGTLVTTIAVESVPRMFLACGTQDIFITDSRRFVERLSQRNIPYEYRELSPLGHSWDLWDGQLVTFIQLLDANWNPQRRS